jgi:hypothetical protein
VNEKRKIEVRMRLEMLIWKQVDLYEKINLRLETGCALLKDDEQIALAEIKVGIGQLELELKTFMGFHDKPIISSGRQQLMFPAIEAIPIDPNEIPF